MDFLGILEKVENKTLEGIAFDDLWYLFKPGDIVLSHLYGYHRAYVVYSVSGGRPRMSDTYSPTSDVTVFNAFRGGGGAESESPSEAGRYTRIRIGGMTASGTVGHYSPLRLECLYTDYNGVHVAPCQATLQIGFFSGVKSIDELTVCPFGFGDATDDILDKLLKRGDRFMSLHGHKLYRGAAVGTPEDIVGEIYVDPETGYREDRGWSRYKPPLGQLKRRSPDPAEFTIPRRRLTQGRQHIDDGPSRFQGRRYFDDDEPSGFQVEVDDEAEMERMEQFLRDNPALLRPVRPCEDEVSKEQLRLLPETVLAYVFRSRRWRKSTHSPAKPRKPHAHFSQVFLLLMT